MGIGRGGDHIAIGSGAAIALTICFWCIGVPTIFTGIIMMVIADSGHVIWTVGLILIILSLLCVAAGIAMIAAICTGCFGKDRVEPMEPHQMTIQTGPQALPHRPVLMFPQAPPPYSPQGYAAPTHPHQTQLFTVHAAEGTSRMGTNQNATPETYDSPPPKYTDIT